MSAPSVAKTSTVPGRVFVATPVFDGASVEDVDNALVRWQQEHTEQGGLIRMDVDDARRADLAAQHFVHPILRAGRGHGGIKVEHQHGVRPSSGEPFLPLIERGQAKRRRAGGKELDRMRRKGRDNRKTPLGPRPA